MLLCTIRILPQLFFIDDARVLFNFSTILSVSRIFYFRPPFATLYPSDVISSNGIYYCAGLASGRHSQLDPGLHRVVEVVEGGPQFPRGLQVYQWHLLRRSHNGGPGRRGEWRWSGERRAEAESVLPAKVYLDPGLDDRPATHHRSQIHSEPWVD